MIGDCLLQVQDLFQKERKMFKSSNASPKNLIYNCHVCEAPAPDHYHFGGNNLLNLLSQLTYTMSDITYTYIYNPGSRSLIISHRSVLFLLPSLFPANSLAGPS